MNETIELLHHALRPALTGLAKVIPKRVLLPVLGHVRVTRDRAGQVFLQGTDLDAFAVYRVPDPTPGPACDYLVPFAPLQQAARSSLTRIELVRESATSVRLRAYLGSAPIEQLLPALPPDEMPPLPEVGGPPQPVDEPFRDALRQALTCCADNPSRPALTHVCLDVRDPDRHYLVATDGQHLFCANSFAFDLKQSVLLPNHRFLHWPGFMAEGTGALTVRPPGQRGGPWFKLASGPVDVHRQARRRHVPGMEAAPAPVPAGPHAGAVRRAGRRDAARRAAAAPGGEGSPLARHARSHRGRRELQGHRPGCDRMVHAGRARRAGQRAAREREAQPGALAQGAALRVGHPRPHGRPHAAGLLAGRAHAADRAAVPAGGRGRPGNSTRNPGERASVRAAGGNPDGRNQPNNAPEPNAA